MDSNQYIDSLLNSCCLDGGNDRVLDGISIDQVAHNADRAIHNSHD